VKRFAQLFSLIFALGAPAATPAAHDTPSVPSSQLQKDIPDLMRQADIPGLSVATVRNGKLGWRHNFGVKNAKSNEPVTDDTIFEAASLSKPVFAYAVLKLVDQGKLALDTPLSSYLDKPYIDGDPRLAQITARFVLSHRTGFPNWRGDGPLQIFFAPGERFSYSGEGFVYLQTIVEKIAGKPLSDLMNELVFAPIGMASSSYTWRSDFDARTAYGHDFDGSPNILRKDEHFNAAASLNTTSRDYALFLAAILSGTGLKPSTLREMETPQIAVDSQCTNCTNREPGELSKDIFWGLGWGIERQGNSKRLWHWGDNGDFKCFVTVDLKQKSAAVMFTDSENGLSIAPAVFREVTGRAPLAFTQHWLKYDLYDSDSSRFGRVARDSSAASALQQFQPQLKSAAISEESINSVGYRLLRRKRVAEAILVFQANADIHPQSWNVWDSLAEAYAASADKPRAIVLYEKSLALNPKNQNALDQLKKLREPQPAPSAP
jgi:CubicO group peptidase (beta-lactamase class C family)